jgi:hypothetical protein
MPRQQSPGSVDKEASMATPRSRRGPSGGGDHAKEARGEGAGRAAAARHRRKPAQPDAEAAGGRPAGRRPLNQAELEDLRRKLREKFH